MLGLFAHPDDELFAAGLLAAAARAGARVTVVTVTRGERGCARDDRHCRGAALAARRSAELDASCRALGVEAARLLDLPDGGLERRACAAKLAALHSELAPDTIVTLGRDGVYGHADHVALTAAVADTAGAARVLHTLFPADLFAPLRRMVDRAGVAPLVAASPLGGEVARADLALALDDELQTRKRSAICAHASQLDGGDPLTFLGRGLAARMLAHEWYALAAGPALPQPVPPLLSPP